MESITKNGITDYLNMIIWEEAAAFLSQESYPEKSLFFEDTDKGTSKYWVGPKVNLGFSVSYGKAQMNFVANPV